MLGTVPIYVRYRANLCQVPCQIMLGTVPIYVRYRANLCQVPCQFMKMNRICVPVNMFTKMTNKMQLCRILYCSLIALHVSRDIFTHHQEHLNCIYSFWYYSRTSLPADQPATTYEKIPETVHTVKMFLMMSEKISLETCRVIKEQ